MGIINPRVDIHNHALFIEITERQEIYMAFTDYNPSDD